MSRELFSAVRRRMRVSAETGNIITYMLRFGLAGVKYALLPVVLVQGFFSSGGVGYSLIGLLGTAANIAQGVGLFIFCGIGDKYRNFASFKRALFLFTFTTTIEAGALIAVMLLRGSLGINALYWIYFAGSALNNLALALVSVLDFPTLTRISPSGAHYGRIMGLAGIPYGLLSVVAGIIVENMTGREGYSSILPLAMVAVGVVCLIASCYLLYRDVSDDRGRNIKNTPFYSPFRVIKDVWGMPEFRDFFAPNVLRALYAGIIYFVAIVGVNRFPDANLVGYIAIVLPAGSFTGYLTITLFSGKLGAGRLYLLGMVASALAVVGTALAPTPIWFALACFVMYSAQILIDEGFPLSIFELIDHSIIGRYSSLRTTVYFTCLSVFIAISGRLLETVQPTWLFVAGGAIAIADGLLFLAVYNKYRKKKLPGPSAGEGK